MPTVYLTPDGAPWDTADQANVDENNRALHIHNNTLFVFVPLPPFNPNTFFQAKVDPASPAGNSPGVASALCAWYHGKTASSAPFSLADAVHAITAPVESAADPLLARDNLWALLAACLAGWPTNRILPLVRLLNAIHHLAEPAPRSAAQATTGPFWHALPDFASVWAKTHRAPPAWRAALAADPRQRSVQRHAHIHHVLVEARLAASGAAGELPLQWGLEYLTQALESGGVVADFEIAGAANWVVVAGRKLCGEVTEERWEEWKGTLEVWGESEETGAEEVVKAAVRVMEAVEGERGGEDVEMEG
ncbi:hypothetical protein MMC13_007585 [Lambiella insularis]|nr:hypothetical protein [Lambiella insularis]